MPFFVRRKLLSCSGSTEQNDFSSSRVAYIVDAMRWINSLRAQIYRRIFWLILESSAFLFWYRTYFWTSSHRTSSEVDDVKYTTAGWRRHMQHVSWTTSVTRRKVDDVRKTTLGGWRHVMPSGARRQVYGVRLTTSGNTRRGTLSIIITMIYSDKVLSIKRTTRVGRRQLDDVRSTIVEAVDWRGLVENRWVVVGLEVNDVRWTTREGRREVDDVRWTTCGGVDVWQVVINEIISCS